MLSQSSYVKCLSHKLLGRDWSLEAVTCWDREGSRSGGISGRVQPSSSPFSDADSKNPRLGFYKEVKFIIIWLSALEAGKSTVPQHLERTSHCVISMTLSITSLGEPEKPGNSDMSSSSHKAFNAQHPESRGRRISTYSKPVCSEQ